MPSNDSIDISFVVIGFNEAASIGPCLQSVREATPEAWTAELIYVDGGSADDSLAIARERGVNLTLGGDKPRRAAENRNLGLEAASGAYVQFVDGDMLLDADWPRAACALLEGRPQTAAVFGVLQERNRNIFYQALQIDWEYPEGPALYCGGAAMFRRADLDAQGGFPTEVAYGEEPLLCWRLRNEDGREIYHLHHRMALHDLAYRGFRDYWRRNVRVGETYAEVAAKLRDTHEPFWQAECRNILGWAVILLVLLVGVALLPGWLRLAPAIVLALIWGRKFLHARRRGVATPVAAVYAAHTYLGKLGAAQGVLRWRLR